MFKKGTENKGLGSIVLNIFTPQKIYSDKFYSADSLLHEESVNGLLLPDELDNQPVQIDEQSSPEAAGDAADTQ